jgi:hypothetical protein
MSLCPQSSILQRALSVINSLSYNVSSAFVYENPLFWTLFKPEVEFLFLYRIENRWTHTLSDGLFVKPLYK